MSYNVAIKWLSAASWKSKTFFCGRARGFSQYCLGAFAVHEAGDKVTSSDALLEQTGQDWCQDRVQIEQRVLGKTGAGFQCGSPEQVTLRHSKKALHVSRQTSDSGDMIALPPLKSFQVDTQTTLYGMILPSPAML